MSGHASEFTREVVIPAASRLVSAGAVCAWAVFLVRFFMGYDLPPMMEGLAILSALAGALSRATGRER